MTLRTGGGVKFPVCRRLRHVIADVWPCRPQIKIYAPAVLRARHNAAAAAAALYTSVIHRNVREYRVTAEDDERGHRS